MIIQYASDLHLEFPENKNFLKTKPLLPVGDILLLAGDIVPFAVLEKHLDFFKYLSDHFRATYWLPGNHEYYHFNYTDEYSNLNSKIGGNIFIVNNQVVTFDQVELLFSTLWGHIPVQQELIVQQRLNDFALIEKDGKPFTPSDFNALHKTSLVFLKTELAHKTTKPRIVLTHHVPTLMHYPKQYRNSNINSAFAVELFDIIDTHAPDYWIYGHHHCNTPQFKLGNTTLLTNQLGYVQQNEHQLFNRSAAITL